MNRTSENVNKFFYKKNNEKTFMKTFLRCKTFIHKMEKYFSRLRRYKEPPNGIKFDMKWTL